MNPADNASRGKKVNALLTGSRWIGGIWKSEEHWPEFVLDTAISTDVPEVKRNFIVSAIKPSATDQILTHFSSSQRLSVAIAWFLKVKKVLFKLDQVRKEVTFNPNDQSTHLELEMKRIRRTLGGQSVSSDDLL